MKSNENTGPLNEQLKRVTASLAETAQNQPGLLSSNPNSKRTALSCWRGIGWLPWAAAAAKTLAEFVALFRRHLLPALFPPLGHATSHVRAKRPAHTQSAEQNPAESQ